MRLTLNFKRRHRGQMFILSTIVIAVYIVTIAAAFIDYQNSSYVLNNQDTLEEIYQSSSREIQNYLEYSLATYTRNFSQDSYSSISDKVYTFIASLNAVNTYLSVSSNIEFLPHTLTIEANQTNVGNISDSIEYKCKISSDFKFVLKDLFSKVSFEGIKSFYYETNCSVKNNYITLTETRGNNFTPCKALEVLLINNSQHYLAVEDFSQTGKYFFPQFGSINDLGYLDIVLYNGVRILS